VKLHDLGTNPTNTTPIGGPIDLPNDMFWTDEHKWVPAVAKPQFTLTGALVIESAAKLAGRPISLEPPEDMAWVSRATVEALREWAATPGRRFKLAFEYPTDTRQFIVVFRHNETPLEATPVLGFPQFADDNWFRLAVRFTQVG
jgi:hypothetical protein